MIKELLEQALKDQEAENLKWINFLKSYRKGINELNDYVDEIYNELLPLNDYKVGIFNISVNKENKSINHTSDCPYIRISFFDGKCGGWTDIEIVPFFEVISVYAKNDNHYYISNVPKTFHCAKGEIRNMEGVPVSSYQDVMQLILKVSNGILTKKNNK